MYVPVLAHEPCIGRCWSIQGDEREQNEKQIELVRQRLVVWQAILNR